MTNGTERRRLKRGVALLPEIMRFLVAVARRRKITVSRAAEEAVKYAKEKGMKP